MSQLPFLKYHGPESVIAWRNGTAITQADFLADVATLARRLPDSAYVINLCDDRYRFLVGLAAALTRKQINLLPPSRAHRVLQQISLSYPGTYCLTDHPEDLQNLSVLHYPDDCSEHADSDTMPAFDADQPAVIAFTSGSTGHPTPHAKTWGALVTGAALTALRFGLEQLRGGIIIGTVPHQHMYGLESTILLPAQSGMATLSGRPFFPADIATALAATPSPRVLITTPVHLRACISVDMPLPGATLVISATAPLAPALAIRAEQLLAAPVYEIYGSTETGAIASRRTLAGDAWQAYDTVTFKADNTACHVSAAHLAASVRLNDMIRIQNEREFILCGRSSDLINIAGKRVSLGDLNHKLNEIPGVIDGVFHMPAESEGRVTRLMAFVVAPDKSAQEIMAQLRRVLDPAFLPRPLLLVETLQRSETGKLPQAQLAKLVIQAAKTEKQLA